MTTVSVPDAPATAVRTRRLLGLDFVDDLSVDATVERILAPQDGQPGEPVVLTPNVDTVVRLGELEAGGLADRCRAARYILPDGQPIVWLSRLLRRPLRARLAGSDLVPPLWRRIVADGRRAMVVAPSEAVASALRAELPSLAAYVPPVFDGGDPGALAAVAEAAAEVIDRAEPEIVFVGISFPKQQRLAFALVDHARRRGGPPPVFLLVGGALEMYVGLVPRAPAWMRRIGAEWFFRFLLEPRRLFRRYFVEDVRFLSIAAREVRAGRGRAPRRDARHCERMASSASASTSMAGSPSTSISTRSR